jgi:TPR repeat protein
MKCYRKAVEQGDADAQFALGRCYEFGKGVPADYEEATKWYRKAAKQGHADAERQYRKLTTGE